MDPETTTPEAGAPEATPEAPATEEAAPAADEAAAPAEGSEEATA